jgi:hypothetical protein
VLAEGLSTVPGSFLAGLEVSTVPLVLTVFSALASALRVLGLGFLFFVGTVDPPSGMVDGASAGLFAGPLGFLGFFFFTSSGTINFPGFLNFAFVFPLISGREPSSSLNFSVPGVDLIAI